MKIKKRKKYDENYLVSDREYIEDNFDAAVLLLENAQSIFDCIESALDALSRSCEFFACPGYEGNRIYHMKTCCNCATVIQIKRLYKRLNKEVPL